MSSTILTVIVLVVMWLVVLVPMFTRQREDSSQSSVERFSSAMRSLGRRTEVAAQVAPEGASELGDDADTGDGADVGGAADVGDGADIGGAADEAVDDVAEDPVEEEFEPVPVQRPMPAARAQMLARRRRTLGTLVSLTLISVLLAVGWRSQLWLANVVFDALLVGYLWWLRQEARREQQRRARRAARGRPVAHVERPQRRPGDRAVRAGDDRSAPSPQAAVDDRRWEPRPVPAARHVAVPPRASYVRDEPLHGPIGLDEQDATLSEDFEDDYPTMEITPPRAVGE